MTLATDVLKQNLPFLHGKFDEDNEKIQIVSGNDSFLWGKCTCSSQTGLPIKKEELIVWLINLRI
jgi:hypothetical protein